MKVYAPKFEQIPIDFSGLSFFAKFKKVWKTRPSFKLTEDWIITLDDGLQLLFPKGFVTDLASVPRIFWLIPGFSPFGPLMYGSIPHDFGYQYGYFLSPFSPDKNYSIPSCAFRKRHVDAFGDNVPVFVDRDQGFFDNFLAGVTIAATAATFVANMAKKVLGLFGHHAWDNYRKIGPTAYGKNSLGLPGVVESGEIY